MVVFLFAALNLNPSHPLPKAPQPHGTEAQRWSPAKMADPKDRSYRHGYGCRYVEVDVDGQLC